MKVRLTGPARKDYQQLDPKPRKQVIKQLDFLKNDLRHPSLNAKKYPELGEEIWQGRVNQDYRFFFLIEGGIYTILRIVPHPK
jgi:mRNA-degrading endonuclease RelE of RelBE toxin-antitoxin system